MIMLRRLIILVLLLAPAVAQAQGVPLINAVADGAQTTRYSLNIEIVLLMTAITLLPSMLLVMTPFVRIIVVMSLLRQALGTGQTPPNQVLVGLALFLSVFVMSPVIGAVYEQALVPYLGNKVTFDQAVDAAHPADAGDQAGAGRVAVVHAVRGQGRQFQEGRAGVQQHLHALARQQLAARQVLVARVLATAFGQPQIGRAHV